MNKTLEIRCDCCGLIVDPKVTEDCPRCKYPVKPEKEELFLQSSIRELQRVSTYGGGNLKVDELIRRYQFRLNTARHFKTLLSPAAEGTQATVAPIVATHSLPEIPKEVKLTPLPVSSQMAAKEKPAD